MKRNDIVLLPDGREGRVTFTSPTHTQVQLPTGYWIGCTKEVTLKSVEK